MLVDALFAKLQELLGVMVVITELVEAHAAVHCWASHQ